MKDLYILTEGDKKSGLGHLMRCIAVAEMLHDNFNVQFVVPADHDEAIDILERKKFEINTVEDWEECLILPEENDLVLMDSYQFPDSLYEGFADQGVRVVVMVDGPEKVTAHAFLCPAGEVKPRTVIDPPLLFFSGPAYAPLRKEFLANAKLPAYSGKKGIVVCFGGADPENFLLQTAQVLAQHFPDQEVTLVTGAAYSGLKALRFFLQAHPKFQHQNNLTAAGMAELFRTHALAITSASMVAYEACASKIPLIVIPSAENQKFQYKYLVDSKLALGLEYPAKLTSLPLSDFLLPTPIAIGADCVSTQDRLFDGKSDERIKDLFLSLSDDFFLRSAHELDEEMLLEWSNEPEARNNSFNTNVITPEEHHEWLSAKLKSESSTLWIAEDIKEPFAMVRIETNKEPKVSGNVVISINVKKEFRGKGMGAKVLRRACLHYFAQHPGHIISALIKNDNEASVRAFTASGFTFVKRFSYRGIETIQMNKKL